MAHAEKLAEEVKVLTARIHDLEGALSNQANGDCHPLLQSRDSQRDEIDILYETGLHEVSDAIGSLAIGQDGQAKYHGETAGSEVRRQIGSSPLVELTHHCVVLPKSSTGMLH